MTGQKEEKKEKEGEEEKTFLRADARADGPIKRSIRNIAKGTTDPRVEFILPKEILEVITQVQT